VRVVTAGRRARAGFTVIEVLVAVMILSVGVLALASTAGFTGRQINDGANRGKAASLAQARFESIASRRASGCNGIVAVGGTVSRDSTYRGIREQWTVTRPLNDGTVRVVDVLTLPRVKGTLSFQSVVRCS
jgi:type IV pilus assembly protein PilV